MNRKNFRTEQEKFWAGDFGTDYIGRNRNPEEIASKTAMFAAILKTARGIGSVVELGANIGLNLHAIRNLLPEAALSAVEINPQAVAILREMPGIAVHEGSLLEGGHGFTGDMAFTAGVLIHIDPASLGRAYEALYKAGKRYIAVIEYFSPMPVAIPYRGHKDRLFKRDFAGELLDTYKDLELRDYGFVYSRDPHFPQDNLNWFLLEKR